MRKDLCVTFCKFGVLLSILLLFQVIPSSIKAKTNFANNNKKVLSEKEDEMEIDEEDIGIADLYKYIDEMKKDDETLNDLDVKSYFESYMKDGSGNISLSDLGHIFLTLLLKEVKVVLSLMLSVIIIAILCSLLKNLQDAFNNGSISNVAFYACYALLIVVLSRSFLVSITVAKDVISEVSGFIGALFPTLITMIAMTGGLVQAATFDPIVLGAVTIIPQVYSVFIIPLIMCYFVLTFANNMSTEHRIDNFCKLVKQVILWSQGIIITTFIALLTIRGITSNTIDAVTLKTTKFAIDNFIPIVGKAFSDAITSVAGYSLIIKNALSGVGLIVIIFIIMVPIVKMVLMTFIYKLSSALVEPISDKRITSSIAAAGEAMVLLLSCVLSVSLMMFILLGIFASTGRYIVGG